MVGLVFVSNIVMQSVAGSASARDDAPPPKECRICRQSGDAEMPLFRCCARTNLPIFLLNSFEMSTWL